MDNKKSNETVKYPLKSGETLGRNIRSKRMERNISQEYLAEMLNLSRQSVSKWENGLSQPSKKNLIQIAKIFQCELTELMTQEEEAYTEKEGIFAVGVAVESSDIGTLKYFFQEMPSDMYDCYNVTFFIICSDSTQQKNIEMKALIEEYSGQKVTWIKSFKEALKNRIYLVSMENYKEGFDSFFYGIANEFGEYCAAVLLSGRESKGTKGIAYIKRQGGLCVLCENDRKSDMGDIWNAVRQSTFEYILEPVNIGYSITLYARKCFFERKEQSFGVEEEKMFRAMEKCLENSSELPISDFREEFLIRGLMERMESTDISSVEMYKRYLETEKSEQTTLAKSIFDYICAGDRDMEQLLKMEDIFEEIRPEINGIRIWVADCGDGLEAYEVAMLLADYMEDKSGNDKIKIFATDMTEEIIVKAISGRYEQNRINGISEKWKEKYFEIKDGICQVTQRIRNMIIFSVHDIITNPPFARLNIMVCRNSMKVFRIRSRKTIISRFLYALNKNGYLFLGQGQDIDELLPWFARWNNNNTIFQKQNGASGSIKPVVSEKDNITVAMIVNEMLAASIPTCIITDSKYEIIYTGAEAGRYLQFRAGEFSRNLFHNIDRELGIYINMTIRNLEKEGDEGRTSVSVKEISDFPYGLCIYVGKKRVMKQTFYLIWFEELKEENEFKYESEAFNIEKEKLEHELTVSQANLAQALRELDTVKSRYELVNEKLQSTNEELVVINEELEVANRELAATNRKLTRVNKEQQIKLNEMPDFMYDGINIYSILKVGIIYLDENFIIKKITDGIPNITNVRHQDIDRYIGDIMLMDNYCQWREDIKAAKGGKKIFRVVDGINKKCVVEILSKNLEDREGHPIYMMVIYEI